jgi:predicted site-specific integrase-resolvase
MRVKLSQWAKQQGISFKTAQRWYYAGIMPVPTEKTPTGRIMVLVDEPVKESRTVLYACVSTSSQKKDLDRQVERLLAFAKSQGWEHTEVVTEIGSEISEEKKKLKGLLFDKTVVRLVVESEDRVSRSGVGYITTLLSSQGRHFVFLEK